MIYVLPSIRQYSTQAAYSIGEDYLSARKVLLTNSDEVLYYAEGNFMSRRGIERGSFTLHPGGLPHGPHPGTVEKSIGTKETHELAVMIDTFRPLHLTTYSLEFLDKNYPMSWTDNSGETFNEVNTP